MEPTLERPFRHGEFRVEIMDILLDDRIGHGNFQDPAHYFFQMVEKIVEDNEIQFAFYVGILGQMASSE